MKKTLRIVLVLSLCLNGYFVWQEIRYRQILELGKIFQAGVGHEGKLSTWPEGFTQFKKRLMQKYPALKHKNYFYINIWTSWCKPCIREMPWLDTLAHQLPKDWACVFVSEMNDQTAGNILQKLKPPLRHFVSLNNMNDFVSALCAKQGIRAKAYPMALVLNQNGELLHFSLGAYSSALEARKFVQLCQDLSKH